MPVLLFLVAHRLAGLRWAVIAATALSITIIIDRRKRGLPLGRFMPILTAAVLVRGAIGALTENEALYFGLGIASKYAAAAALVISAALRKPLARHALPHVLDLPPRATEHPRYQAAATAMTVVGGLYYLASATVDVWLFQKTSVEGFVALRFLASWPLGALTLATVGATTQHHLTKIPGISSILELFERKMAMLDRPS